MRFVWVGCAVAVIGLVVACGGGGSRTPRPSGKIEETPVTKAEVFGIKDVPFTRADGNETHLIQISWKNTGNTPIRRLEVDIDVLNEFGKRLSANSAKNYTLYLVPKSEPGVLPGEALGQKTDAGYILPIVPGETPARYEVQIVKASSVGYDGSAH